MSERTDPHLEVMAGGWRGELEGQREGTREWFLTDL